MRKVGWVLAASLVVFLAGAILFEQSPTLAKAADLGRYQTAVEGSRTRLFAAAFRLDTLTGKAWKSLVQGQKADEWAEIEEGEGSAPDGAGEIGKYQFSTTYLADAKGQELAAIVRVDTTTGKVWHVRIDPPRWRWVEILDGKTK